MVFQIPNDCRELERIRLMLRPVHFHRPQSELERSYIQRERYVAKTGY